MLNIIKAMNSEGIPVGKGGYMPIYLQAMFQKKIALGKNGLPFISGEYNKEIDYSKGICPVAEEMWFKKLIYVKVQNYIFSNGQIHRMNHAINKILNNKTQIKNFYEESIKN